MISAYFSPNSDKMTFSTGESNITDRKTCILAGNSSLKLLAVSLVNYLWIIEIFFQLFELSFWRHPFTTGDPLLNKWFWTRVNYYFKLNVKAQ